MKPLSSHVLIEKKIPETKSAGGIILPPNAADTSVNTDFGTALAIGPGRYENGVLIPMNVKVGDTVAYSRFAQYPTIKHDGKVCFLILEQGLLAIL
jgi:chaperonin GroES